MTFGEKIQKLRKEAGLSQEELACQLGVSRQAVSKWERDSGYPETEKIVHMSRLFNVTLDYLLNEENSRRDQDSAPSRTEEEKGFYVSLETARGFLACQKVRYRKISLAVFLFIAGLAFSFMESETGILIFMLFVIAGAVLLFSVKLSDTPYRRIWLEPLLFDKNVLSELTSEYTDYRKKNTHRNSYRNRSDRNRHPVFPASASGRTGALGQCSSGSRNDSGGGRRISVHLSDRHGKILPAAYQKYRSVNRLSPLQKGVIFP